MQKSFWSNWFKPATANSRKWTLEELGELYDVLLRNGVVTEHNRAVVVETIRTIAEYILWGDQNEPRIFDFFLENNILTYLHKVLLQPSNRTGEVAKQVLQTLSIIIQNVRSETGIFFLFSNNHINNIVDLDFDFSDEEVLGYYISFLKTISLKLNTGTVHFFLNSSSTGRGFPLYTRAIRLAHNREGMVRAAVRTLTLNVYSVPDPDIISFVSAAPACQYFTEVAHYLAEQVQLLDRHLAASEAGGAQALGSLDSQLAETEDVLSYVSDLLSLGVPSISQLLAASLWQWVVRPLLLRPLMQAGAAQQAAAAAGSSAHRSSLHRNSSGIAAGTPVGSPRPAAAAAGGGHYRHWSWGSGSWGPEAAARQPGPGKVRPVCAVYVLERVFLLVAYQPLLQQLLLALTCGVAQQPPAPSTSASSSNHPLQDSSSSRADNSSSSSSAGSSCRACLLAMLQSGQPLPVLLVLRLFVAIVNSKSLQPELLSSLSLLPRKHLQQQGGRASAGSSSLEALVQLLHQQLQVAAAGPVGVAASGVVHQGVLGDGSKPAPAAGAFSSSGSSSIPQQADLLLLLTEQYLPRQLPDSATATGSSSSSDGSSDTGSSSSRAVEYLRSLDQWGAQAEQQQQQQQRQAAGDPPSAAAAVTPGSSTFAGFGPQLLSGLMQLLQLRSMPPMGLWLLGWLLHQLLPVSAVTGAAAAAAAGDAAAGQHRHQHRPSQSIGGEGDEGDDGTGWGFGADGSSSSSRDGLSRSNSGSSSRQGPVSSSTGRAAEQQQQQQLRIAAEHGLEPAPPMPPLSTTRAISVQSSLGFEPRASLLNPEQQQLLQEALDAAHAVFGQQLGSMWCEAVFPLLGVEWPISRDMMLRPVLRASSAELMSGRGVWPVLRALQEQQRQQQQQQGSRQQQQQGEGQHSVSAQAALECYLAVQRVVALTQVQELLSVGCVPFTPPVPTVSESDLKQVDIQEGYQVDLAPGSALPCVVSFAPGQERRVYFAVAGLSQQQMAALQGPSEPGTQHINSSTSSTPGATRNTHSLSGTAPPPPAAAAAAGGVHHGSLLRSLPVAVLADPSPSRPQAGVVLSVAPLLGARPYTDPQVGKWLHVHVRPSVRGLLRIIKTSSAKQGGLLAAMRQLADGHWVLAFSSGDKAALAVTLVQQHAARLQALYGDALAPMCGTAQQQEAQQAEAEQQQQEGQQAEYEQQAGREQQQQVVQQANAEQQALQQQQQQQQQQEAQQQEAQQDESEQQAGQEQQLELQQPMQQAGDYPQQQDRLPEQQPPYEQLPKQPTAEMQAPLQQQQQQQQNSPVEGAAAGQAALVGQTSDASAEVQEAVLQVTNSIAQASLVDSAEDLG